VPGPPAPTPTTNGVTRRRLLTVAAGGAAAWILGGCAKENEPAEPGPAAPATATPSASATPTASAGRLVAMGQSGDADTLLALGILPVGISKAYNDAGIYPWTKEALGDRSVEFISDIDAIPFERIAALRPDRIVATTHYGFAEARANLEAIAPALGPATTADQERWQQSTTRIGDFVGLGAQARALVEGTEAKIRSHRDAHPDWAGRTFTMSPVFAGMGLYTVNSTDDISAAMLAQLGLTLSPKVTALPTSETPGRALVSAENMEIIDADALLLVHFDDAERAKIEADPLFKQIPAVQRGSYVAVDGDVGVGLAFPSVLSIPWALERIAPQLEQALAKR
jgi:iron complex transport system substrate-binding protein